MEIYMVISSKITEFSIPHVTPCSCRVLLEKLVVPQQVMKFSTLYGT
jgi:hypothetical protein